MNRSLSAAGRVSLFVVSLALAACSDSVSPTTQVVLIQGVPDTLDRGDSVRISATIRDASDDLVESPVEWTSSDPSVADVLPGGWLRGIANGTVTLTARGGGAATTRRVVVADPFTFEIAGPDSLKLGDSASYTVAIRDRDDNVVQDTSITWSTPDWLLARVSAAGSLYVRGFGDIRLVATSGKHADTLVIRVPMQKVMGLPPLLRISFTQIWTCALSETGEAYCSSGGMTNWVKKTTDARFTEIEVGQYGVCALATDARAFCWAHEGRGVWHTDGRTRSIPEPTPLETDLRFMDIADTEHGTMCFVSLNQEPYCWGHNDYFQTGREPRVGLVSGLERVTGNISAVEVDGNGFETCAADATGAVFCWGAAGYITGITSVSSPTPRRIPFSQPLHGVSVGSGVACALTPERHAVCWGWNYEGGLGNGTHNVVSTTPVPVSGGLRFSMLAAGQAICGITLEGALYCWGYKLGFREHDASVPVRVAPGRLFRYVYNDWVANRACAIDFVGDAYCF
jgi:hypothetical protein